MTNPNNSKTEGDDIYLTVPKGDAPWHQFITDVVPYRIANSKRMMSWYLIKGLIADTLEQLNVEALMFRHAKSKNSPDDVLNYLGQEYGLIQVTPDETNAEYRERINNRWSVLPYYGQESSLQSTLNVVYDDVTIYTDLVGNDVDLTAPKLYTDSNYTIPAYPPSSEYKSQFSIRILLPSSLGVGTESDLLTDVQLNTIRALIKSLKPVNWVCREIILQYSPSNLLLWDDPQVGEWDNVTHPDFNYWHDDSEITSLVSERHRAQLDV